MKRIITLLSVLLIAFGLFMVAVGLIALPETPFVGDDLPEMPFSLLCIVFAIFPIWKDDKRNSYTVDIYRNR